VDLQDFLALPLASMCPTIQIDFAVDKLSRLQIKQQVGHFSNFKDTRARVVFPARALLANYADLRA
jgi:hypothetical protein